VFVHDAGDVSFIKKQLYSFTACRAECQIEKQLKLCNCTHHLITKKGNPDNKTKKFVKKLKLKCQCIPECEFTEIHIIRNSVNG
ncbi:hypothetical protein C0J52_05474, partial [Blattella germanica]